MNVLNWICIHYCVNGYLHLLYQGYERKIANSNAISDWVTYLSILQVSFASTQFEK